jgi:hypothetical protein
MGFNHSAQGCDEGATLGLRPNNSSTPTGLDHRGKFGGNPDGVDFILVCHPAQPRFHRVNAGLNDEIPLGFSADRTRGGIEDGKLKRATVSSLTWIEIVGSEPKWVCSLLLGVTVIEFV